MPQRILLADDDPVVRRLVRGVLEDAGFEVTAVADGELAWQELQRDDSPWLVIADWTMPDCSGLELCRRIREAEGPYRYVVMLSSRDDPDEIATGLAAGADDYLTKPAHFGELLERVRAGMRILAMQRRHISMQHHLREQATHDELTGVLNRRALMSALATESARAQRTKTTFAALLVDIDSFKGINDTYGHDVGDATLREIASRLAEALRPSDHLGRIGGEEFLVLLPNASIADAVCVAERLREIVAREPIAVDDRAILHVTASVGATAASGDDDTARALKRADLALYEAKRSGRNRVVARAPSGTV